MTAQIKTEEVPVRRKTKKAFYELPDWGINDIISSIRDDVLYRFPEAVRKEPRINVKETDDRFTVIAEVPGMTRQNLQVEVDEDTVSITGERMAVKKSKDTEKWIRKERAYGSFSRTFTLPSAVKANEVTAECANGILTIELPKQESTKRHIVDVE